MNNRGYVRAVVPAMALAAASVLVVAASGKLTASPVGLTAATTTAPYSKHCANAPMPLPASENLTVRGNKLLAGGHPFVVRGVIIEGLDASQAVLAKGTSVDNGKKISLAVEEQARKAFGAAELYAARCYGANTLRIHIAQPSADPKNREFSLSHLQELVSAVKLARANGLAVIVDIQDEPLSGEHHTVGNPTAATQRAWRELAPMLSGIPGVMLELFNEPMLKASASDWQTWLNGGPAPVHGGTGTVMTVGTQTMVNTIRGLNVPNPIVVMGLLSGFGGWTLQGMPTLKDPANQGDPQLVYSVHFPPVTKSVSTERPLWDEAFGTPARSLPVMVGAFNVSSKARCSAQSPATATTLVTSYLSGRGIGVAGWAFDYPDSIFHKIGAATGDLTNFTNFTCGATGTSFGGDGELLYTAFTQ